MDLAVLRRHDGSGAGLYAGACRNQSLAVGATCEFSAYLRPATPGDKSARISIAATGQAPSTIALNAVVSPA